MTALRLKCFTFALLAGSLFALFGCVSEQSVVNDLKTNFDGKNFDEFVLKFGVPQSKFALNSGEIAYIWNSGTTSVQMPATATTTTAGNTSTSQIVGGGSLNLVCELQIVTAPDGTIRHMKIMKDSIGMWTTSRCHEVLK